MSASTSTAVLVWSLTDEPTFFEYLEARHPGYRICPLRYAAMRTARRQLPAGRIIDMADIVRPDERASFERQAAAQASTFYKLLMEDKDSPWLACLPFDVMSPVFYYAAYWQLALDRLAALTENGALAHYGPFSRGAIPGHHLLEVDLLETFVARREERRTGHVYRAGPATRLRWAVLTQLGQWIGAHPTIFADGKPEMPADMHPAGCVVCGLQETDRVVQAELVRRLAASGQLKFTWLIPTSSVLPISEDEQTASSGMDEVARLVTRVSTRHAMKWKRGFYRTCTKTHAVSRYARAMARATAGTIDEAMAFQMGELLGRAYDDTCLNYWSVAAVMDRLNPSVVLGNSSIDEMIDVQRWTRLRRRTFIRLPHGIEFNYDDAYCWDAEQVGMFGRHFADRLVRDQPQLKDKVFLTGGLHLAGQAAQAGRWTPENVPSGPRIAMFVVSGSYIREYPDTVREIREDFRALAQAASAAGWSLHVRCHPRLADDSIHRLVVEELRQEGLDISLSDSSRSLNRALQASSCAVVRIWGGAAMVALYLGIPLIGWTPRPGLQGSADIVQSLPLSSTDAASFGQSLSSLSGDEAGLRRILELQEQVLANLVDRPRADPYSAAVAELAPRLRAAVGA